MNLPTPLEARPDLIWAWQTHCGKQIPCPYQFAVLYGRTDSPTTISFWRSRRPRYKSPPDFSWTALDTLTRKGGV